MDQEEELKLVIPGHRTRDVREWLRSEFAPDNEHPCSRVSSIYFDSFRWDSVLEKTHSDYLKQKARLRWYQDENGQPIGKVYAETKNKIGSKRTKSRKELEVGAAQMETVQLDDPSLCHPSHPERTPVFLVRYFRERFWDPAMGWRLSLDFDIDIPKVNPVRIAPMGTVPTLKMSVCEIKGDVDPLPDRFRPLFEMGARREAYSKYWEAYKLLNER